ncbi:hypothetical protein ACFODO_13985 [Acinetobacter sichuanensis]|uniref:Uncharacterized protein n=1 Tax=Acinetobacter sichuanensis TaxID=2136183 RepID=A0A371YJP4_9GAMM|nr:hypothetical protein [Acinetobacter sichuanensis]RFC81681.1 hypothetical protein C9E89_020495 [Acinetobacter sichuanensis]
MALNNQTFIDLERDANDTGKFVNTKQIITPRYGNPFKSAPLIAAELAENGMFQPFATEVLLKAYIPVVVPTVAKALDSKKVFIWEIRAPKIKAEWYDTGLSEKEQAISAAAVDAKSKADAAQANAISAAATDAKSKADAAQANAISAAATDAKFKADAAQANAISAAATDAKSKADAAQANAISAAAIDAKTKADAVFEHFDKKIKGSEGESLFDFCDEDGNKVIEILPDGDINSPKFGKVSMISDSFKTLADNAEIEAKNYADEKTKALSETEAVSLFDFCDEDGNIVVRFMSNADIQTAGLDGRGLVEEIQNLKLTTPLIESDDSLYLFKDADGNTVFKISKDGDIDYPKKTRQLPPVSFPVGKINKFERLTEDFQELYLNSKLLNGECNLPISKGMFSQKFRISDNQDFLNLKIEQPERISLDTPYYQDGQIVHPFLWSGYKSFRGYKYILAATPYENTNDIFENPCLWGTNDLENYELLSDMPQPLEERFAGRYNYNSDVFCFYDHTTDEFCVGWRNGSNTTNGFDLWVKRTTDGYIWSEKERIAPKSYGLLLSPNILYNATIDKWVLYSISNDPNGSFSGNRFCYRTADILGEWSEATYIETPFTAWHQETRYCGNQLITIINDNYTTHQLYLGISDNGFDWVFNPEAIVTGNYLPTYKASITPFFEDTKLKFNIFWTSSDRFTDLSNRWRLYHVVTQPISVQEI